MTYNFYYDFPTLQEVPVKGWDDVNHKITSNKQSKQRLNQSKDSYLNWLREQNFPDTLLGLKYDIIDVALKSRINLEQSKWETRKPENETIAFYDNGWKYGEEVISSDNLSVTDLQNKAGKAAEKLVSELVHKYYPFTHPGSQVFDETCDPICKEIFTIKRKDTQVPENEVYGPNSHPDLYFNFECETNEGQKLDLHILCEVKSVLASPKSDNNLEITFNNATNCKNLVLKDLDTFKDRNVFLNLDGNTGENANKTKIYTTLTVILYYFPDTKENTLVFFDYNLSFMPLTLEFDISPKTGEITDKIFKTKSAGENSVNNNVNLSLTTPQGIYEDQDIVFNRLLLYLTGKTLSGQNHLLTKQEVLLDVLKKKCDELDTILKQWPDVDFTNVNKVYRSFLRVYKYVQKYVDKEFRSYINDYDHQYVCYTYDKAKEQFNTIKMTTKYTNECIEVEKNIKTLLDIQDSMSYREFKLECDAIRKTWNRVKKIDDKFCPNRSKIQESINGFRKAIAYKKRNS